MNRLKRIFLSYGHDEFKNLALRLKSDLTKRGHEVWFDQERLQVGSDWEAYIEEGLDWVSELPNAGCIVVLMTPHSVRRPDGFCLNEIARAIQRRVSVIPVMLVWCEPPISICRIQWLDMQDCLPLDEQADRYEQKLDLLFAALEGGRLDVEGTQSRLLHTLKPLDFTADIAEHVPRFMGRQWIFESIDRWLADPNASKVFWIAGAPGIGKTAIAAYLCHKRKEVAAFHLCRYGHEDKSDPRRCIMSLAYQLATQLTGYWERLKLVNLSEEVRKSPATIFDNIIVQPLGPPFLPPIHQILIVIDALDEATQNGRNELAEFIANEFPRTPEWLRLVITSRWEEEVTQPLQGLNPHVLKASSPENIEDIKNYLEKYFSTSIDEKTKSEAIETILRKSGGVFLYVEKVLSDLRKGMLSLNSLNEFPQGLGEIFMNFFSRQFPDIKDYRSRIRPLIEMVIAAKGPLPVYLLSAALELDVYDSHEMLGKLGALFPREDNLIRPFHRSVIDWIIDPGKGGRYFIDINKGKESITNACWTEYRAGKERMSEYSREHLATHIFELGRLDELLTLATDPELALIAGWIDQGEGDKVLSVLGSLVDYLAKGDMEPVTLAGFATQMARVHSMRGDYVNAHSCLVHAAGMTSRRVGRRVKAVAVHELGSLYLYKGDFHQAKRFYNHALRLCACAEPILIDEEASNLVGLATVSTAELNFSEAIKYAKKGMRKALLVGDLYHTVAAHRLIGSSCRSLGKYDEAEIHIREAMALSDTYGLGMEGARLTLLLGWLEYDKSVINCSICSAAIDCFEEALEKAKKVEDFFCQIEARLSIGWAALSKNDTEGALGLLEPIEEALPKGRHNDLRAGVRLGLAALIQQQGKIKEAVSLYEGVSSFCKEHCIRLWGCKAMVGLGAALFHSGRMEEAEGVWKEAVDTAEGISMARRALIETSIKLCRKDPVTTPR